MTIAERDSISLQQNKQGVVDANVTSDTLKQRAMECLKWGDKPREGLELFWEVEKNDPKREELHKLKTDGSLRRIRISDSFFSDTFRKTDIRKEIFKRAVDDDVPVEFLLANPQGSFGKSRASAIAQSPNRSQDGLYELALACYDARIESNKLPDITEDEIRCSGNREAEWDDTARALIAVCSGLPVSIRLYDKTPSGPYFFFGDMLLAGRFWTSNTAAYYPWSQIVDTPYPDDLYDTLLTEYNSLWESATPLDQIVSGIGTPKSGRSGKKVFLSYSEVNEETANEIGQDLKDRNLEVYAYATNLRSGHHWPDEMKAHLKACDTLVAIVSNEVVQNKEWIRAEIGAAWVLDKRIFQAKLGTDTSLLPGITQAIWAKRIDAQKDRSDLIDDVVDNAGDAIWHADGK